MTVSGLGPDPDPTIRLFEKLLIFAMIFDFLILGESSSVRDPGQYIKAKSRKMTSDRSEEVIC